VILFLLTLGCLDLNPMFVNREPALVPQEQQAGLVPVKTGGARHRKKPKVRPQGGRKKRGGAKKRVARKGVPLNKRR